MNPRRRRIQRLRRKWISLPCGMGERSMLLWGLRRALGHTDFRKWKKPEVPVTRIGVIG